MILDLLVEQLEELGYGTRGKDLFIYNMPASVEKGILLINQMPIEIHRYALHRKGTFQIVARGTDTTETREVMDKLTRDMRCEGLDLGDLYFHYILPQHEPFVFPRSGSDQIEVSGDFDFAYTVVE